MLDSFGKILFLDGQIKIININFCLLIVLLIFKRVIYPHTKKLNYIHKTLKHFNICRNYNDERNIYEYTLKCNILFVLIFESKREVVTYDNLQRDFLFR